MSAAAGDPVSVQILDKEYLIACPPGEREALLQAAELLNERLKKIREQGKVMGTERLVIMAALNMANDLAQIAAREQRTTGQIGARVRGMRERVERALVHGQQLEL